MINVSYCLFLFQIHREKCGRDMSINFNCHNKTINDESSNPNLKIKGRFCSEAPRAANTARIDPSLQMQRLKTRPVHTSKDTPRLFFD